MRINRKLLIDTVNCMIEVGIAERHCVRAIKYYGFDVFHRAAKSLYNQDRLVTEEKFFNYLQHISATPRGNAPKEICHILIKVIDELEARFESLG